MVTADDDKPVGKKSGVPNILDYEGDDFHLAGLQALAEKLQKDLPEAKLDAKGIAQFQTGLLNFLEDALGVKSLPPRPFPKLPTSFIEDVRPSGSLYKIICKTFQMKDSKGIRKLEWRNPQLRQGILAIIDSCRSMMIKEGQLVMPLVYFHESCPKEEVQRAADDIKSLKGRVATHPAEQGITHWVYPFGPNGDPDDGQEYMRTQRKRGHKAYVHWWYLPDSYNEWININVAPGQLDVDADHAQRGPAKVYLRWIWDSKKYNEWMNALDYETESAADDHERHKQELEAAEESGKRPAPLSGMVPLPSQAKVMVVSQEVDPLDVRRMGEGIVKRKVVTPYRRALEGGLNSENLSQGQLPKLMEGSSAAMAMASVQKEPPGATPREASAAAPQPPQGRAAIEDVEMATEAAEAAPVLRSAEHTESSAAQSATARDAPAGPSQTQTGGAPFPLPTHTHWFRFGRVHEIEVRGNAEFFNGICASKTPDLYMQYRDHMINAYRANPAQRLTFSAARARLRGDVTALQRLWTFLNNWGLINADAPPSRLLDEPVEMLKPDTAEHRLCKDLRVIRPLPAHMPAPSTHDIAAFPPARPPAAIAAATSGRHIVAMASKKEQHIKALRDSSGGRAFHCSAMPWVDCSDVRYHCTKYPDVDLCPAAYAEGRFPPGTSSKDFIKIDRTTSVADPSGWSEQETLLLLEGLEKFGDKWADVAEHVNTKNAVDCVLHFLQLPIEEDFIDEIETTKAVEPTPRWLPGDGPPRLELPAEHLAFGNDGNPLMAQIAFLAEVIGPKVAAAAASAALEALWDAGAAAVQPTNGQPAATAPNAQPQVPGSAQAPSQDQGSAAQGQAPVAAAGQPASQPPVQAAASAEERPRLDEPIPDAALRAAGAAALAAAAVKAKLLADQEERRMQHLVTQAIDAQTRRLEIKFRYLQELETTLDQEHASLMAARQAGTKERQARLQPRQ